MNNFHLSPCRYDDRSSTLLGEGKKMTTMAKTFIAIIMLATLSACVDNAGSSWDRQAWVDPTFKPNYASLKALEHRY